MFIKRLLIFTLTAISVHCTGHAQESDFCEAVTAILRDAPNQFRNVHGTLSESNATASMFKTNIKVPGVLNARFVSSMGLFYEGAVFQSNKKDGLMAAYDKYKNWLSNCLSAQGYTMHLTDNFYPQVEEFKKVVYMQPIKEDADIKKLPGHMALEVDYNKTSGLYTMSFYIFEH